MAGRVRVTQHKVECDGMSFDSREEMKYYLMLKDDSSVSCIHRQVQLELVPKSEVSMIKHLKTKDKVIPKFLDHPITYKPDFIYLKDGVIFVVDVKSSFTHSFREFSIIRKLMLKKILEHNKKRHEGLARMVFREVIFGKGGSIKIVDKPPVDSFQ